MTHIILSRIVIETISPMAINTGGRETGFDTQLARDVNGLPYIPGTSVAGVWRHICESAIGEEESRFWFGFSDRDKSSRSLLAVSNGCIHDHMNKPVQGLKPLSAISKDPLLAELKREKPLHREHVRMNDRGVAAHEGKYDQVLLPTGTRFTIELRVQTDSYSSEFEKRWLNLVSLWNDRRFVFGATTRNGLGRFKIISTQQNLIDLQQGATASKCIADWRNGVNCNNLNLPANVNEATKLIAELGVKALDNWRSGVGSQQLGKVSDSNVNIITYSENVIEWKSNQGALSRAPRAVLAGSTIKGILAHRIAFHYNRHTQRWAENLEEASHKEWEARPLGLSQILGHADEENHEASTAGKLFIDDAQIEYKDTIVRTHNSIDRFTGGVRKGALYSEELLYQPSFTIRIWAPSEISLDKALKSALADTVKDIETGLLPFGAGAGRGNSLVERDPKGTWNTDFSGVKETSHKGQEVSA